ncbi:MAG: calcium-binding protein, partial [Pseudomonadota bacterium]
ADTLIVGDWIGGDNATVQDFDTVEDKLVVVYDDAQGGTPVLQLVEDAESPGITLVLLNGATILALENADELQASDVSLVAKSTVNLSA